MLVNVPPERDLSLAWLPPRRQIIIDVTGAFQYSARANGVTSTALPCPVKLDDRSIARYLYLNVFENERERKRLRPLRGPDRLYGAINN